MIKESFRKYLEEAIGGDNALVAFSAFDAPASVSVRRNPFKTGKAPEGREVEWCAHGRLLSERPQFTLILISMVERIMFRIHHRCLLDMFSERWLHKSIVRSDAL